MLHVLVIGIGSVERWAGRMPSCAGEQAGPHACPWAPDIGGAACECGNIAMATGQLAGWSTQSAVSTSIQTRILHNVNRNSIGRLYQQTFNKL